MRDVPVNQRHLDAEGCDLWNRAYEEAMDPHLVARVSIDFLEKIYKSA